MCIARVSSESMKKDDADDGGDVGGPRTSKRRVTWVVHEQVNGAKLHLSSSLSLLAHHSVLSLSLCSMCLISPLCVSLSRVSSGGSMRKNEVDDVNNR